jgi:hypothetical protein
VDLIGYRVHLLKNEVGMPSAVGASVEIVIIEQIVKWRWRKKAYEAKIIRYTRMAGYLRLREVHFGAGIKFSLSPREVPDSYVKIPVRPRAAESPRFIPKLIPKL